MNCFRDCLLRNAWLVALATVLGFAVGVVGSAFISCLITEGVIQISAGGGLIWLGGTITIACMLAALLTPFPWIVGLISALIAFVASSAFLLFWCNSVCNANVGVGSAGVVQQGLSTDGSNPFGDSAGPIDCASATVALTEVQQALANAEKERDEKQRDLNDAVGNANTARNLMIAAVAALAVAPFWNLTAIAVAAAAVAVTTANWLYRQALVATASAALAAAQALVNALEGAVAAAQAAKEAACGPAEVGIPVDGSTDVGTGEPPGIDLGTQ